jgi:hypothetical protein
MVQSNILIMLRFVLENDRLLKKVKAPAKSNHLSPKYDRLGIQILPERNDHVPKSTARSQKQSKELGITAPWDPNRPCAGITSSGGSRKRSLYSSLLLASSGLCTTKNRATSEAKRESGERARCCDSGGGGDRIRTQAAPTEGSGAESCSPEWAEAGEEPPDASTAGGADRRRRGGEAGEGAVVGVSAGLARLGEATVGEAMPAGAGGEAG